MPRLCSSWLLSLLVASSASALTMAWTPIGNPNNPADTAVMTCCGSGTGSTGFGPVAYAYYIGTYEVTNAQYAEFLNAKAAADPLGLYDNNMSDPSTYIGNVGGITRSGSNGGYTYSAIAGRENMPVNNVSFYDALRFANWMNNGQGNGDTETGAYTLLGGAATPSNHPTVTRNAGATIVLASENEWYKAAYYSAASSTYFLYPTGSNSGFFALCSAPTTQANHANCSADAGDLTPVGSYTGSASPYGTFDQGGNVWEWTEGVPSDGFTRAIRGGSWINDTNFVAAYVRYPLAATNYGGEIGFRLVMIPEPGTGLLVFAGLLSLAGWRRARA